MPAPTVSQLCSAAASMMVRLGIVGQIDAKIGESATTQWVGKPGGEDFHFVVTLEPMPPAKE